MDKATLKIRARFYRKGLATEEQLMSAVEEYSSAIIAQSKCSKLRELLIQMYSSANDDTALLPEGTENKKRLDDLIAIQRVMRLIDELPPVA